MTVDELIQEGIKETKESYNATSGTTSLAYGLFAIAYSISILTDTIKTMSEKND